MTHKPASDNERDRTPTGQQQQAESETLAAEGEARAAEGEAGAAQSGNGAPQDQNDLAGELQRLREERDALFERLARATADFKNAQRRMQAEMEQHVQFANSSLIKSLLPVLDNFERALAVDPANTDVPGLLKGMQIVHDHWMQVLRDQHVEQIAPEPGTPFDPNLHEAMMQQEADYDEPTVVQVLQKGYTLHGRMLRPAQVIVSK